MALFASSAIMGEEEVGVAGILGLTALPSSVTLGLGNRNIAGDASPISDVTISKPRHYDRDEIRSLVSR